METGTIFSIALRPSASQNKPTPDYLLFVIVGTLIDDRPLVAILNVMGKRVSASAKAVTRVIGYIRVSTDKQADEGVSLDAQRAQLTAYAALYGLEIVAVVEDAGESAKSLSRPGLARALAMLAAGEAEGLLVSKLDRLTRSVRDLGELIAGPFARAALLSVAEQIDTRSAAGRLVLNVLASVSQWEREAISERTATAMQHMRQAGQYTGGRVPYGYRLAEDGALVDDGEEQATLARARALADDGMSLGAIGRILASEGRVSRVGKAFAPQQVKGMLRDVAGAA